MRQRALLAGCTDYTGVSLEDILAHLREWLEMTKETTIALASLKSKVNSQSAIFEHPQAVVDYIDCFCDLFERYASDFRRLVKEIPEGVRQSHVEIISQLYKSSCLEENHCVQFNRDFILHSLKDERARGLLDSIYAETRDTLIDYRDLSNLVPRLRTFISPLTPAPMVDIKPTVWGVGLDLKEIWRRLSDWWRQRRP